MGIRGSKGKLGSLSSVVAAAGLLAACCAPGDLDCPELRLNHIQVLASHNSYHQEPEPTLMAALRGVVGDQANGWEYTHLPLPQELDHGVREIELDVFVDSPSGGHYATPKVVPLLGLAPIDPRMSQPGLKVLHIQEIDFRSSCPTFVSCLEQVKAWSDAHPDHLPITIQIEPKDDSIGDPAGLGFVDPLLWTTPAFATLEAEIESVFPHERLIRPADVKGDHSTLREAVLDTGWPTLESARGKVMFTLDDTGAERALYRALHPDVSDRLVFAAAAPPDPEAAFVVMNDPFDTAEIQSLVAQGYLVRTRADADTVQSRTGDTSARDAAWSSAAHFVSTDYVVPDPRFTDYAVAVPGGNPARCNPVSAPAGCRSDQLEE
jgi:hypothetical protein